MGSVRQPEYRTRAHPNTSQCSQPQSGTAPCRSCLPAKPTPFTSTSFKWSRAKAATAGLGLPRLQTRGQQGGGRVRCRHVHGRHMGATHAIRICHAAHEAEVEAACLPHGLVATTPAQQHKHLPVQEESKLHCHDSQGTYEAAGHRRFLATLQMHNWMLKSSTSRHATRPRSGPHLPPQCPSCRPSLAPHRSAAPAEQARQQKTADIAPHQPYASLRATRFASGVGLVASHQPRQGRVG